MIRSITNLRFYRQTVGCLAACAVAASASFASAAVVVDKADSDNQTAYSASGTDLINSGQATFSSPIVNPSSDPEQYRPVNNFGVLDVLNNGSVGGVSTKEDGTLEVESDSPPPEGEYQVTFNLDTSTNDLGYDLTEVKVISAWNDRRSSQKFEAFYSTVGSDTFTEIGDGPYEKKRLAGGSTRITLTEDTTGNLASGADAVRFNLLTPQVNNQEAGPVYRELDVEGSATIPEPGSLAVIGLGGLMLLGRRRARNV